MRDGIGGRPGSRHEVFAPLNTSFGMSELLASFGEREPPYPAWTPYSKYERTLRHGAIVWLDREYSEAEATWWTLYWRHTHTVSKGRRSWQRHGPPPQPRGALRPWAVGRSPL